MKPLGDRRARVRFEVLGALRGTLELTEVARVVDISLHGALIESRAKVALGSLHEVQLTLGGQAARVAARVSRLEAVRGAEQDDRPDLQVYRIGLEFLSPPSILTESIALLTGEA